MVGAVSDITSVKVADLLTGLPNRRLLTDRLEQAVAQARRKGNRVALMLLDLDDFKIINDTQGHSAGDSVLVIIAQRLRASVRACSSVGQKAPLPTFTSSTRPCSPALSFLLRMLAVISGTLSTVAVTSRIAYSRRSAGARLAPARACSTPGPCAPCARACPTSPWWWTPG